MGWIIFLIVVGLAILIWKSQQKLKAKPDNSPELYLGGPTVAMSVREFTDEETQEYRDEDYREQWRDVLADHLGKKEAKRLEPCYRELFGGDIQCLFNFTMFMSRVDHGHKALIIPPDDHYRPRFETLAATRAVLRGDAAQPIDLLWCLGMDQLRGLADAVGAKRAQSKDELRRRIAALGAEAVAAAWPALGIPESDIFLLDPDRIQGLCG